MIKIIRMSNYTIEQLKNMSCASYAGSNCVLRQCMFFCVKQQKIDELKNTNSNNSNNNSNNNTNNDKKYIDPLYGV